MPVTIAPRLCDYCQQPTEGLLMRAVPRDPASPRVAVDHEGCYAQHMLVVHGHHAVAVDLAEALL